jgi:excinuclease UvrABC ATPase subunit
MYKPAPDGSSFETLTDEGSRQELIDSWTTLDQRIFNAMHKPCPACDGQGYKVSRQGKMVVRDKAGCYECHGLGAVAKEAA